MRVLEVTPGQLHPGDYVCEGARIVQIVWSATNPHVMTVTVDRLSDWTISTSLCDFEPIAIDGSTCLVGEGEIVRVLR